MRPILSTLDSGNMRWRDSILFGNLDLRPWVGPNIKNVLIRKFCVFSFKTIFTAPLGYAVPVVVQFCSNLQMIGVHARRVVANMHDDHSIKNRSDAPLVHNPMGAGRTLARKQENTVAVRILGSHPFPTSCFLDFVSSVKNIINGKHWELIKTALFSHLVVVLPAKFSADGVGITKQAFNDSSGRISHGGLLKNLHDNCVPWERQICL